MAMNLDTVVPWGRSFEEYVRMFALTEEDLKGRILGCGDGPAAFNSALTGRGGRIVSCDPLYLFSADQIRQRIEATFATVMAQVEQSREDFVWDVIANPEDLGRLRLAAMAAFLADFERGKGEERYVAAALPKLPFAAGAFDLALCSHLLFLYSEQLSFEFHLGAVAEMCRVAREVRIFPLVDLAGQPLYAEKLDDLPKIFHEVAAAWSEALEHGAQFSAMQAAIRARDVRRIKEIWNRLIPIWDDRTFYGFIATSDAFMRRSFRHLEIFGQVGFGTGGWDTDFPNSMLEILRQDYIRTARAKGASEASVNYHHALKNAVLPVITVIGIVAGVRAAHARSQGRRDCWRPEPVEQRRGQRVRTLPFFPDATMGDD